MANGELVSTRLYHQIVIAFDSVVMNAGAIVCLGSFPSNTLSAVAVPQHPAATAEYFYMHPLQPRACYWVVDRLFAGRCGATISHRPWSRRINKTRRLTIVQHSPAHDRLRRINSYCNNGVKMAYSG